VIECNKHKMGAILNPPLRIANYTIKRFKRISHVEASETNESDDSSNKNQKQIGNRKSILKLDPLTKFEAAVLFDVK